MAQGTGQAVIECRTTDPQSGPQPEEQILLILVGLPGSSKSTFSNALVSCSQLPEWCAPRPPPAISRESCSAGSSQVQQLLTRRRWTRVSQDEAPSRRRQECEQQVIDALRRGENVAVDRVNFDPSQRAHFVALGEIARPKPIIYALTLDVSLATLRSRLSDRLSHPTIPDAETGKRVLGQMTAIWDPPRPDRAEGFYRVYILPESRQPVEGLWTMELLGEVLDDIALNGATETGPRYAGASQSHGSHAAGRGRGRERGSGAFGARGRGHGNDSGYGNGYGYAPGPVPARGGHWNAGAPYPARYDGVNRESRGGFSSHPRPYDQPYRGTARPPYAYGISHASSASHSSPASGYTPPARPPPYRSTYDPSVPPPATSSWRRQPDLPN